MFEYVLYITEQKTSFISFYILHFFCFSRRGKARYNRKENILNYFYNFLCEMKDE